MTDSIRTYRELAEELSGIVSGSASGVRGSFGSLRSIAAQQRRAMLIVDALDRAQIALAGSALNGGVAYLLGEIRENSLMVSAVDPVELAEEKLTAVDYNELPIRDIARLVSGLPEIADACAFCGDANLIGSVGRFSACLPCFSHHSYLPAETVNAAAAARQRAPVACADDCSHIAPATLSPLAQAEVAENQAINKWQTFRDCFAQAVTVVVSPQRSRAARRRAAKLNRPVAPSVWRSRPIPAAIAAATRQRIAAEIAVAELRARGLAPIAGGCDVLDCEYCGQSDDPANFRLVTERALGEQGDHDVALCDDCYACVSEFDVLEYVLAEIAVAELRARGLSPISGGSDTWAVYEAAQAGDAEAATELRRRARQSRPLPTAVATEDRQPRRSRAMRRAHTATIRHDRRQSRRSLGSALRSAEQEAVAELNRRGLPPISGGSEISADLLIDLRYRLDCEYWANDAACPVGASYVLEAHGSPTVLACKHHARQWSESGESTRLNLADRIDWWLTRGMQHFASCAPELLPLGIPALRQWRATCPKHGMISEGDYAPTQSAANVHRLDQVTTIMTAARAEIARLRELPATDFLINWSAGENACAICGRIGEDGSLEGIEGDYQWLAGVEVTELSGDSQADDQGYYFSVWAHGFVSICGECLEDHLSLCDLCESHYTPDSWKIHGSVVDRHGVDDQGNCVRHYSTLSDPLACGRCAAVLCAECDRSAEGCAGGCLEAAAELRARGWWPIAGGCDVEFTRRDYVTAVIDVDALVLSNESNPACGQVNEDNDPDDHDCDWCAFAYGALDFVDSGLRSARDSHVQSGALVCTQVNRSLDRAAAYVAMAFAAAEKGSDLRHCSNIFDLAQIAIEQTVGSVARGSLEGLLERENELRSWCGLDPVDDAESYGLPPVSGGCDVPAPDLDRCGECGAPTFADDDHECEPETECELCGRYIKANFPADECPHCGDGVDDDSDHDCSDTMPRVEFCACVSGIDPRYPNLALLPGLGGRATLHVLSDAEVRALRDAAQGGA